MWENMFWFPHFKRESIGVLAQSATFQGPFLLFKKTSYR